MKNIIKYREGVICINGMSGKRFTCSGKYSIDESGIYDTENKNYIYMPFDDYWAVIIND